MNSPLVRVWLTVLLLALAVYGGYSFFRVYQAMNQATDAADASPATAMQPPRSPSEFTFRDRFGNDFPLRQMEGRVWVSSFFFVNCPGFCRQMNSTIAGLVDENAGEDVTFVSFSVDPVNDTPGALDSYAKGFKADPERWVFLTGKYGDAQTLGQEVFQVAAAGQDHSDRLVLIDRSGKIRGRFNAMDPLQLNMFRKELKAALAEPADRVSHRPTADDGSSS